MTRLLTWFKRLLIAAAVVLIGFVALAPNKDTYTSNADAPMVTRTLVPRETTTTVKPFTTTTARTSSAVSAEKALDEIVIIDGTHVYRLPRSASRRRARPALPAATLAWWTA